MGYSCPLSVWVEPLAFHLLDFHVAAAFYDADTLLELWCFGVFGESLFALPCLAKHEYILAGCTFEHVVTDDTFVLLCFGCQQDGCFEGFVVLAFLGLKETIQSNHNSFLLLVVELVVFFYFFYRILLLNLFLFHRINLI